MEQKVFETYESEVRSYCRKFPTVFTKAKNAAMYDENGNEYTSLAVGVCFERVDGELLFVASD